MLAGGIGVSIRQANGRQVAQAATEGDHFGDAASRRASTGALPSPAAAQRAPLGRRDGRHVGLRHRARRLFAGQRLHVVAGTGSSRRRSRRLRRRSVPSTTGAGVWRRRRHPRTSGRWRFALSRH